MTVYFLTHKKALLNICNFIIEKLLIGLLNLIQIREKRLLSLKPNEVF